MQKLLIYGLQNSGATLFALFAGQAPSSFVIPDLWSMHCAPEWNFPSPVCLKAVVTTAFSLSQHKERFRPDKSILLVRRPQDNYLSLIRKNFRHHDGLMAEKFALVDELFSQSGAFDAVIRFEDFIRSPQEAAATLSQLGWTLPADAARMTRSPYDMELQLWQHAAGLYDLIQWGAGNAQPMPISKVRLTQSDDAAARDFAERYAPRLTAAYDADPPAGVRKASTKHAAQGDSEFQRAESLAARLMGFFNQAIGSKDRQLAEKVLRDLRAVAPFTVMHWNAALRFDEVFVKTGHAAKVLSRFLIRAQDAELETALAAHFFRIQNLDRAKDRIQQALKLDNRLVWTHVLASQICLATKLESEAGEHAHHALEIEPRSVMANKLLADVLRRSGQVEQAKQLYQFCLAVNPEFAPARNELDKIGSL